MRAKNVTLLVNNRLFTINGERYYTPVFSFSVPLKVLKMKRAVKEPVGVSFN